MSGDLAVLGINARAERMYRLLLRHPRQGVAELAAMLGIEAADVRRIAHPLLRAGLVREEPDGSLVASAPNAALDTLVEQELARVEERRRHLEEVRTSVADFAAEHLAGQAQEWSRSSVDLVVGEQVGAAFEDLTRSATGDVLVVHSVPGGSPWSSNIPRVLEHYRRRTRLVRCLYPVDALADGGRGAYVRFVAEHGATVRLVDEIDHRMVVFGDVAAIVSGADEENGVHHVIRAPELVRVLRTLFEMLWRAGVPYNRDPLALDEERRRLLQLLATGLKDEGIARHLNLSLRSVRRRTADLLDELGASTRFQAGMEAVRRGLI